MNPRTLMLAASLFLMAIISVPPLVAQDTEQQSSTQKWQGTLDVQVAKLNLQIVVTNKDGKFSGEIISVDQGNAKIPITNMAIEGNDVVIEAASVSASFHGTLNEAGDTVTGTWKQGQVEVDFEIKRVDKFSSARHIESWKGTLVAGPQKFEFRLRIFAEKDGTRSAKLDSFNESLMGIPAELDIEGDDFNFEIKLTKAVYRGKYNEDKTKIEGKWIQAGGEFPLEFEKTALDEKHEPNRPQHPRKPYPYDEEQVTYENSVDGITLAATLTKPKGDGPFPAVVLISGSGPQDRDETIFAHKPFWVIADHLTRNGFAVLRFDERGIGKSTGNFAAATSKDFARDVEAGIDFLKNHPTIDGKTIGLIGHSEGGIIAPMIAARRPDVAMIVMLAGPGVDGAEISLSQSRAILEASGAAQSALDLHTSFMRKFYDELKSNDGTPSEEFMTKLKQEYPEQSGSIDQLKTTTSSPWFQFFMFYDPTTALKKVKCPVLVLNGTKDLQVLVDLNVDAIVAALNEGGNSSFETHKLENLNHLFQTTQGTGLVTEYGQLEETFAPVALELMSTWLKKQTK